MNDQNPKLNSELSPVQESPVQETPAQEPDSCCRGGKHRKKLSGGAIAALAAACLILAAAIGGGYVLYGYDRAYSGVNVCGADLSGMTYAQAGKALETRFKQLNNVGDLSIVINGTEYVITAKDSGIFYDVQQTVSEAMKHGRTGSPFERIGTIVRTWRKGAEIEPVLTLDEKSLRARIGNIASAVASSVGQPTFSYKDGVLTIDKGTEGYSVDPDTLFVFVQQKLTDGDYSMADFAPDVVSPRKLTIEEITSAVERELVQPTLDLKTDPTGGTVDPGQEGITLDADMLKSVLENETRVVTMKANITEPAYTEEEYRALLFRDVMGKGTTSFDSSNIGRTTNVLLATEACNNVILMPGDTFSYNDTVGPRTYERGFKDAIVYIGTTAEAGVGGGICQVSSTLYYAALRADLEIVERSAHSRTVSYVPLGEDATVAWGSKDFKFKNNTDFPVKVVATHTGHSLTIKLCGTQTVEGKEVKMDTKVLSHTPFSIVHQIDPTLPVGTTKVKSNGYSGYVTETYRVVYINGKEVSRTFENKSTYTKYDKVILENPAPAVNPQPVTDPDPAPPTAPTTPTEPTTPTPADPTVPTDPVTPTP